MTTQTIRKGATLEGMVRQFNKAHGAHVTVAQVARANHLKDANHIETGAKLRFPDVFERRKTSGPQVPRKTAPTTPQKPSDEPCRVDPNPVYTRITQGNILLPKSQPKTSILD